MEEMENHPAKLLIDGHCKQEVARQVDHDHDGGPDALGARPVDVAVDHHVGVDFVVV